MPYTEVIFSFMGSVSLVCYNLDFLAILKEMLTFPLLSDRGYTVPQENLVI